MNVPIILLIIGFSLSLGVICSEQLIVRASKLVNIIKKYEWHSLMAFKGIPRIFVIMLLFIMGQMLLTLSIKGTFPQSTLPIGLIIIGMGLSLMVICFRPQLSKKLNHKSSMKHSRRILFIASIVLCLTLGPLIFSYTIRREIQAPVDYELSAVALFIPTQEMYMSYKFFAFFDIGQTHARVCNSYRIPFFISEQVS